MSREIQRPTIVVNHFFEDKRSAMEAFVTVLVREMEQRSIRTFETVNEPEYTSCEREVKSNDTTA